MLRRTAAGMVACVSNLQENALFIICISVNKQCKASTPTFNAGTVIAFEFQPSAASAKWSNQEKRRDKEVDVR